MWWIATGAEIAQWWLDRDAMRLALTETEDSDDLSLVVEAPVGSGSREVWIDITLPGDRIPFEGNRQLAYARTEWGLRIPLRPFSAGETRSLRLVVPIEDVAPTPTP
jgi:hypothetical protein